MTSGLEFHLVRIGLISAIPFLFPCLGVWTLHFSCIYTGRYNDFTTWAGYSEVLMFRSCVFGTEAMVHSFFLSAYVNK